MKIPSLKEWARKADFLEEGIDGVGAGSQLTGEFRPVVADSASLLERGKGDSSVGWVDSPEVAGDRKGKTMLSAEESAALVADAAGKW